MNPYSQFARARFCCAMYSSVILLMAPRFIMVIAVAFGIVQVASLLECQPMEIDPSLTTFHILNNLTRFESANYSFCKDTNILKTSFRYNFQGQVLI